MTDSGATRIPRRLRSLTDTDHHLAKTVVCDEGALQWAHVDTLAPRFERHLRPLVQAVDLTATHPEAPLLAAIAFLKRAFAKGRSLPQLPSTTTS